MKRKFSELETDSDDENIIKHQHKRRRLNRTTLVNNIFQNKFNVSFDLKSILDEYLDIKLEHQDFCIYCQKFHLQDDCIVCDCCDKVVCEECEEQHWFKVLDFRDNTSFTCCPGCVKSFRKCNVCRTRYATIRDRCDNIRCKTCKKYFCILCMPFRFCKVNINTENVHVGGGKYREYNNAICSNRIYCKHCIFKNMSRYPNDCFTIIKD